MESHREAETHSTRNFDEFRVTAVPMFANHLSATTELFQAAHTELASFRSGPNNVRKPGLPLRRASHRCRLPPLDPRFRARASAVKDQFWKCRRDNAHRNDKFPQRRCESKLRTGQSPELEHPHFPAVFRPALVAPLSLSRQRDRRGAAKLLIVLSNLDRQINQRRDDTNHREQVRNRAECFPVHTVKMSSSTNERVQLSRIQTGFAIVLPAQLEKRESILVGSKATIHRLIQIDEAALNDEQCHHWLR